MRAERLFHDVMVVFAGHRQENAAVNQGGVADFRNTAGTAAPSSTQQARDKGLVNLSAEVSGVLTVADENAQVQRIHFFDAFGRAHEGGAAVGVHVDDGEFRLGDEVRFRDDRGAGTII